MTHTVRHIGPDKYAAVEIDKAILIGLIEKLGGANASSIASATWDTSSWDQEKITQLAGWMCQQEAGERFSVGDYDLLVLRFVCEIQPVTIVALESCQPSYPALVDGHLTDRDAAISAWLGDGDEADHPHLYLQRSRGRA